MISQSQACLPGVVLYMTKKSQPAFSRYGNRILEFIFTILSLVLTFMNRDEKRDRRQELQRPKL